MKVYVIHRSQHEYARNKRAGYLRQATYDDLVEYIRARCEENGIDPGFFQSNHEGTLVDIIQQAYYEKADAIIINPAAYTHTSIAIHDALKAVGPAGCRSAPVKHFRARGLPGKLIYNPRLC